MDSVIGRPLVFGSVFRDVSDGLEVMDALVEADSGSDCLVRGNREILIVRADFRINTS